MELEDLKRYNPLLSPVVRRHGWIIVLFVVLGGAYGYFQLRRQHVDFQSDAKMYVTGRVVMADTPSAFAEEVANYLGTQIEIMRSEQIHQRSLQRLALAGQTSSVPATLLVSVAERTTVLDLSCVSADGDYARHYLDAVMEEFMEFKRDRRLAVSQNTLEQIKGEIARLEDDLAQQEAAFFAFRENNNIGFWEQQSAASAGYLTELKSREANLKLELSLMTNWRRLSSEQELPPSLMTAAGPGTANGSSGGMMGELNALRHELSRLEVERELRLRVLRPAHPIVKQLSAEIEKQEMLAAAMEKELARVGDQRQIALESELASVRAAIAEWEVKALESSRIEAEYQKLSDARDRTKDLYDRMLGSLRNLDVGRGMDQELVQVLQPATPAHPIMPAVRTSVANGAFVGGLAGWLIFWLLVRSDDRAYSLETTVDFLRCPGLGEVPLRSRNRVSMRRTRYEEAAFDEAFRRLRSLLMIDRQDHTGVVFLVTSSLASEGKTEVSVNLARAFAAAGKRVLLIDADLRRGRIASLFPGMDQAPHGFAQFLEHKLPASDVVQSTSDANLSVLPRGLEARKGGDLFSLSRVNARIDELRQGFDVIIIDSAPIGPVDDTAGILASAEKVLFVVRAASTSLRTVAQNVGRLKDMGVAQPQIVLNGVKAELSSKYYNYYR
ncbi:GumC family protein [Actomonas aquatica]|uniref:Polysaccharide biosynthesis tyrosine autokinase n=1 Tax=Actomonas aquatica TaxID=2866162 RepID=A0ABZ1CDQ8_9BACT|nr:polysaccharide biosynthesis tyrosine autokinase [Opitutus sp. WL0086]WRQ88425.1 polysaccharide biosynthesis tyrosine autokinase [Opitutus sp. WL0086]